MVETSCWMLGSSEPSSIPAFAMPKVFFHPGPPILQVGPGYFHPHRTLLVWKCIMMGFEFLKARQLLYHKPEHKDLTVLVSYMMSGTFKEPPLFFYASLAWIWAAPSSASCIMSCWMLLHDHSQVCYTLMSCAGRTWTSRRLAISLSINGLSLLVTIYRGPPQQKMMCVHIKSIMFSFLTFLKAFAFAHLEK